MRRILIVDDHPLVRAGFAQLIGDTSGLEVCGECADMADDVLRATMATRMMAQDPELPTAVGQQHGIVNQQAPADGY